MTSEGGSLSRRLRSVVAVALAVGVLAAASPGAAVADESADTDSVESTSSPSASPTNDPTVDPSADPGSEPSVEPTPEAVTDPSVAPPDAALPLRPVLIAVTPADASAIATYLPVDDPSVTGYQISPDGYLWFDCPDLSAPVDSRRYEQSGVSRVAEIPDLPPVCPGRSDRDHSRHLRLGQAESLAQTAQAGNGDVRGSGQWPRGFRKPGRRKLAPCRAYDSARAFRTALLSVTCRWLLRCRVVAP